MRTVPIGWEAVCHPAHLLWESACYATVFLRAFFSSRGKLAAEMLCHRRFCQVTHPAAILRADVAQKGLMVQRAIVTIADAVDEL